MGASAYIAWYSIASGSPRDFWRDKLNPGRTNLTKISGEFQDQDGEKVRLADFGNQQVIGTFVFKDCGISCPVIMSDLKYFDAENPRFRDRGVFLIFTFDDFRGKTEQLRDFLHKYHITDKHWRVLTSDAKTIRTLADTFQLQYNKGPEGNYVYMHSNFFMVADRGGKITREIRGVETDKKKFIREIRSAL
jgi:protein SCO1